MCVGHCVSRARAASGGFWISSRVQKMITNEMIRARGINLSEVQGWQNIASPAQIGGMLGNCVPVPLIGEVLQNALFAAGLISTKRQFPLDD